MRDSIAEHYSRLTDGELQNLARQLATLTPDAQNALTNELHTRKVSADFTPVASHSTSTEVFFRTRRAVLWLESIAFWLAHTLLGTLGIAVSVAILFYSIKDPLTAVAPSLAFHNALLIIPFFPLQSLVGALCGLLTARKENVFWRSRSAELAWILPALWLAFLFYNNYSPSGFPGLPETRWQHFFWSSIPRVRGLQLGTTMPFLASLAYAVGHYVGRTAQNQRDAVTAGASCL